MTLYSIAIHIVPRRGILDPQGKAVADALHSLGFDSVEDVRVGRHLVLRVRADDVDAARDGATRMCQQLLANPVTEDFELEEPRPAGSDAKA